MEQLDPEERPSHRSRGSGVPAAKTFFEDPPVPEGLRGIDVINEQKMGT
jgi:hypothetical protein